MLQHPHSKIALAIMVALSLTACGESAEEKQARLFKEQQAQIQQLQNQQMQQAQIQQQQQVQQPQYAPQPQVIQQPAAPVVVQAPHQDNTLLNMATGALIGHTIANMGNNNNDRPTERVVERTIVHHVPAPTTGPAVTPAPVASVAPPTPAAPVTTPSAPKAGAMDMAKLSESAKYSPPSSTPSVAAPSAPKPSSMNMSALSSSASRPAVSLAKPSSGGMNMSRLSSAGRR